MAFDAGAVVATLSVDTAKADADLDRIASKVKALEDGRHVIKISAVFDDAATGKARATFASLDNAISRDAMQRLRSSPQGSVLGALNALFSPHPVSGAPSPQQAASQGLLGKIFSPQGGGTTSMPGGTGSSSSTSTNVVRDVVTGQSSTQPGTATEQVKLVQQGAAPSPGTGTEKVKLEADTTDFAKESQDAGSKGGDDAGKNWTSKFADSLAGGGITAAIGRIFGGGGGGIKDTAGKSGGDSGDAYVKDFGAHLFAGVGPLILGMRVKMAAVGTAAAVGLAALPAVAGLIGTGMGVAMIGGLVAEAVKGNAEVKAQFSAIGADLQSTLTKAAAPIIPAISKVLGQVPSLIKSIEPELAGIFKVVAPQIQGIYNGLKPIVTGLVSIAQAAAPAFGPFIGAIEKLVSSLLPGIAVVVRATVPVLSQFGQIMGTLGKNLGGFFSAAAPAVRASMTVLGALLGVVGSLLPVIVKLGDVFASALAPVITAFAGTIRTLTPVLTIIGKVVAQLASAMLGDLVSAFTAVAQLVTGIAPGLSAFASAISGIFTVLENTGVFATLGDALENLVPLLANLVNSLLTGLAPILPTVIGFLSQLSVVMTGELTSALGQILPPLTQLATAVLQALATTLPVVLPVLTKVFAVFTGATAGAIAAIAGGLAKMLTTIPKGTLDTLAGLAATLLILKKTGIISLGFKLVGAAQKLWQWLSGGTVDVASAGMQKAGDTMAEAAAAMQKAADTMVTADEAKPGAPVATTAETGAEDTAGVAGLTTVFAGALRAVLGPALIAVIVDSVSKSLAGKVGTSLGIPKISTSSTLGKTLSSAADTTAMEVPVLGQFIDVLKGLFGGTSEAAKATDALTASQQRLNAVLGQVKDSAAADKTAAGLYDTAISQLSLDTAAGKTSQETLAAALTASGMNANDALTAVDAYTLAVAQNGVQSDGAKAARAQLVSDFEAAGLNAGQAQLLVSQFTTQIQQNGTTAADKAADRKNLINDLENAGLTAQEATTFVDNLNKALSDMPSAKTVKVIVDGNGTWTINEATQTAESQGPGGNTVIHGNAAGGYISDGTGPTADDVNIRVSKGEYVVKAASVAKYGTGMMNAINAGAFADGGIVGSVSGAQALPGWVTNNYNATVTQMAMSVVQAMQAAIKTASAAAASSAKGGATTHGGMSAAAIEALWTSLGGPAYAAPNMARIADAESGDDPSIVQAGEPPGLTGWGLYQITPTSGITQNGQFGNLLNASNNTKAAIYLFSSDGYSPWSSDPVGAGLSPHGAAGGLVASMLGPMVRFAQGGPVRAFANGGVIPEPVIGFGQRSGGTYRFAEHGPETVVPGGGSDLAKEIRALRADFNSLTKEHIAVSKAIPGAAGQHFGAVLNNAAHTAAYRNRYPRGGS
jgi:phage-related protein